MFTLSGFADEISSDLEMQLSVLKELNINYLELRGVWDKNVLDLTREEIERVKSKLDEARVSVSAIGSPIGKIGIEDDFEKHIDRFERALHLAGRFNTDYIRIFSYYIPEKGDPEEYEDEVLKRMKVKTEMAEDYGKVLLHENEREIYGDVPVRCREILETIDSDNLKAIFDPANFIAVGVQPYPDAYEKLKEYIEYLHIKDAKFGGEVEIKPAGEGDGKIGKTLKKLKESGFDGFLSLEPHLSIAGKKKGFSGPKAFEAAAKSLKEVIEEVGGRYK